MQNVNTERIATLGILLILSLVVVFHLLIITRVIPFEIVWGGRLKDASQMLRFEAVSIAVNLLMLAVVALHAGMLKLKVSRALLKGALWAMCALFLLNTVGNLFSNNELEKLLFTPLTLLLSLLSLRLALSKKQASYT